MVLGVLRGTMYAISLASFGAAAPFFADGTGFDFTTSGGIIGALFLFIGTSATILYKAVLAPIFGTFVKNLETQAVERSTFLVYVLEINKAYTDNKVKDAVNQEKMVGILTEMDRQLKVLTTNTVRSRTNAEQERNNKGTNGAANAGNAPVQSETPLPVQS